MRLCGKSVILAVSLLSLLLLSDVGRVAIAVQDTAWSNDQKEELVRSQEYVGWDLDRQIAIIYDPNDAILSHTALEVFRSTSMLYHNTFLVSVSSIEALQNLILSEEYWIKLYFLKGTLEGVEFNGILSWSELASILSQETETYHIFGSGSTDRLYAEISPTQTNIRVEGSEIIGAELCYFYNLWEIGDIMAIDTDSTCGYSW